MLTRLRTRAIHKAARRAGLDRMWVYRMMQKHGISATDGGDDNDSSDAASG